MAKQQRKKDHRDTGKKRRRMRADEAARHARAAPPRPTRDEGDTVTYKRGSDSDRNQRGIARHQIRG